jgi:hypothetical protein
MFESQFKALANVRVTILMDRLQSSERHQGAARNSTQDH